MDIEDVSQGLPGNVRDLQRSAQMLSDLYRKMANRDRPCASDMQGFHLLQFKIHAAL